MPEKNKRIMIKRICEKKSPVHVKNANIPRLYRPADISVDQQSVAVVTQPSHATPAGVRPRVPAGPSQRRCVTRVLRRVRDISGCEGRVWARWPDFTAEAGVSLPDLIGPRVGLFLEAVEILTI